MLGLAGKIAGANAPNILCLLLVGLLTVLPADRARSADTPQDSIPAAAGVAGTPGTDVQGQKEAPSSHMETEAAVLTSQDCRKCHEQPQKEIEAAGMAHKTRVTCIDCHRSHPPDKWGAIPECSLCHSGEKHFEMGIRCLDCHYNPHTPLKLKLTRNITAPCLTCHEEQNAQLRQYPSFHSRLACTACHFQHGLIPPCGRCHAPHNDAMSEEVCHTCHKAHQPLNIAYDEVASEDCGVCHGEVYALLAESPRKHRLLKCSRCHVEKHKMVPDCRMCHNLPHPDLIHEKFPVCGECHGIAHNLRPADAGDRLPRAEKGEAAGDENPNQTK